MELSEAPIYYIAYTDDETVVPGPGAYKYRVLQNIVTEELVSSSYKCVLTKRYNSNSLITLNTLWDNEKKPFDMLLNYCKQFKILISVDDLNKKVNFIQQSDFFSNYTIEDWTKKLDLSKDFIVKPITFDSKYVSFNYNESGTTLSDSYYDKYGYRFGEKRIQTYYQFNSSTNSLFDNTYESIIRSEAFVPWNYLYEQFNITYVYTDDIFVDCKDDDGNYVSVSGQSFMYGNLKDFDTELDGRTILISDDTQYQNDLNKFCNTDIRDGSEVEVTKYPLLLNKYVFNGENIWTTFGIPYVEYDITNQNSYENKGIYDLIWEKYINDRYSKNTKQLTCYLNILPQDYMNFDFNKFILINDQLYLLNKISDYDVTSHSSTKCELITVNDVDNYKTKNFTV